MDNILFLDYDGVVNTKMWSSYRGEWECRYNFPCDGKVNNEQAVQWVSEFCEKYKYDIVVISSWRTENNYANCLINAGLRKSIRILGRVSPSKSKSEAIRDYIKDHGEIRRYLIFDDEHIPKHYRHLVRCNPTRGFSEVEYNKAAKKHMKMGAKHNG